MASLGPVADEQDTYLFQGDPDAVQGGVGILGIGVLESDAVRTVADFDISAIPAGATITGLTVAANVDTGGGEAFQCVMRLVNTLYDEATATWNTPWSTPGGDASLAGSGFLAPTSSGAWSFEADATGIGFAQTALDERSGLLSLMLTKLDEDADDLLILTEGSLTVTVTYEEAEGASGRVRSRIRGRRRCA